MWAHRARGRPHRGRPSPLALRAYASVGLREGPLNPHPGQPSVSLREKWRSRARVPDKQTLPKAEACAAPRPEEERRHGVAERVLCSGTRTRLRTMDRPCCSLFRGYFESGGIVHRAFYQALLGGFDHGGGVFGGEILREFYPQGGFFQQVGSLVPFK